MSEKRTSVFPSAPPAEWQGRFVDAVLALPSANLPRGAVEAIAPFVPQPKNLLQHSTTASPWRLRPELIKTVTTSAGTITILQLQVHGAAGSVWERNERHSSAWRSAADPQGDHDLPALPALRTWTGITSKEVEQAYAALRAEVDSLKYLVSVIERAGNELEVSTGSRPYDLTEDLALNGQLEPCLLVAQQYVLREPPTGNDERASFWTWAAVRGNNRTLARQELLGLTSAEVVTGVPAAKLGLPDNANVLVNPSFWISRLADRLNRELREAEAAGSSEAIAYRARKVAVVEAELVIGSDTPSRLYQIVQSTNRRDHVHPPLDFRPNDRARAVGRSVIAAYADGGLISDIEAEVLIGDRPVTALPDMPGHASISVQRDVRSMRLLEALFPSIEQAERREKIRSVLSEPAPSQLSAVHMRQRLRAWSALTSVSYPNPWNPRVADVLRPSAAKDGVRLSGRSLPDLLNAAETDHQAFEELVVLRAPHWLAAFDIIDADRGSMGAQQLRMDAADPHDDSAESERRIRRSVTNAIAAMRADRARTVGLLRELAAAMDEGRAPQPVDPDGRPESESTPASQAWFDRTFPKAVRSVGRPSSVRMEIAAAPEETDSAAVERLRGELSALLDSIRESIRSVPEVAEEIRERARGAGIARPLTRTRADEMVVQLAQMVRAMRELPDVILSLADTEE
ncbi:hypothetical protein ACIBI9_40060 [Nonomuraea sp. NPDC050451]|uniref:hypothetical protein n=1 Tax=Nonomuraea sp. NPDC050451 TaxID=3364364 RepID=UPI0037B1CE0D